MIRLFNCGGTGQQPAAPRERERDIYTDEWFFFWEGNVFRGDMSEDERRSFIDACKCLHSAPSLTPPDVAPGARTRWDDFVVAHVLNTYDVHRSPWLVPFHRELMYQFEKALREECGYGGGESSEHGDGSVVVVVVVLVVVAVVVNMMLTMHLQAWHIGTGRDTMTSLQSSGRCLTIPTPH